MQPGFSPDAQVMRVFAEKNNDVASVRALTQLTRLDYPEAVPTTFQCNSSDSHMTKKIHVSEPGNFSRRFGLLPIAGWTLAILCILGWTLHRHHQETLADAANEARNYFKLNLHYRTWNARMGGIYASVAKVAPNPYLPVPERDITTTDGRRFTLINPAYMTRMVFDSISAEPGLPVISKLTSLKALNPSNAPDPWERKALIDFESGLQQERTEMVSLHGAPYLRLISSFMTEKPCLKCHAVQGYRLGDVRGAISISIPLASYLRSEQRTVFNLAIGYLLLWAAGCAGIAAYSRRRFDQERSLIDSERKFRSLFTSMQEGFALHEIICDREGTPIDYRYLEVNPAFEKLTGLGRSDVVGRTVREVMPGQQDSWIDAYGAVALTGESAHFERFYQGLGRDFEVTAYSPKPGQFATIFFDVTEQRRLQEEMIKAQKLDSLGVLAGGLAHDFNNILTAIIGNISLARIMTGEEHKASRRLTECEKAASRAAEITRQLLTFSRGGDPERTRVDTRQLLQEAVSFSLYGSNCRGRFEIDESVWHLDADAGQLHQAVNNLVINALQAMPEGGLVTVKAANATIEAGEARLLPAGRYVRIAITDHGCGIPQEQLKLIFDPYFTTKDHGTGLGLTSVYSIVKRHGGLLRVESAEGSGSSFEMLLPAAADTTGETPLRSPGNQPLQHENPILVMDDEEMIRSIAAAMLSELGHASVTCCDGEEAVRLYREALGRHQPFSAVILDMTVPGGMGGKAAAEQIRAMDPEAVLIISSGYGTDSLLDDNGVNLFNGAIKKPYSMSRFAGVIGRTGDGAGT